MKTTLIASAIVVFGLSAVARAADDAPRTWHLLQKQADGGISGIVHGLTKGECEFAKNRLERNPATPQEKAAEAADGAAMVLRASTWMDNHPDCKQMITTSAASKNGDEFMDQGDGYCVWFQPGGGRFYSPHDVMTAECFQ